MTTAIVQQTRAGRARITATTFDFEALFYEATDLEFELRCFVRHHHFGFKVSKPCKISRQHCDVNAVTDYIELTFQVSQ